MSPLATTVIHCQALIYINVTIYSGFFIFLCTIYTRNDLICFKVVNFLPLEIKIHSIFLFEKFNNYWCSFPSWYSMRNINLVLFKSFNICLTCYYFNSSMTSSSFRLGIPEISSMKEDLLYCSSWLVDSLFSLAHFPSSKICPCTFWFSRKSFL